MVLSVVHAASEIYGVLVQLERVSRVAVYCYHGVASGERC